MPFEWDEVKREQNLAKHGIDFRRVGQLFGRHVVEVIVERRDYGEQRIHCLGEIEGRVYSVIYTWRGENRRLISARKANAREQRAYYRRNR